MEIFGIGPLEFIFIVLIALIVLGPNDMMKAGRTIGRALRKIVTSSEWRTIQQASKEFRYLPNKLIREAGLEELRDELGDKNKISGQLGLDKMKEDYAQWKQDLSSWVTPPDITSGEDEVSTKPDQSITPDTKNDGQDSDPS